MEKVNFYVKEELETKKKLIICNDSEEDKLLQIKDDELLFKIIYIKKKLQKRLMYQIFIHKTLEFVK